MALTHIDVPLIRRTRRWAFEANLLHISYTALSFRVEARAGIEPARQAATSEEVSFTYGNRR